MGRCQVTGWETENKWKGMHIAKECLQLAQEYVESGKSTTIRNALVLINRQFLSEYAQNNGNIDLSNVGKAVDSAASGQQKDVYSIAPNKCPAVHSVASEQEISE